MSVLNEVIYLIQLIIYQFRLLGLYWIGGLIAGSVISVLAGKKMNGFVIGIASIRSVFLTIVFASVLGAVSPLCMYGTVPLMASLSKKGLPQYLLVAFMISSVLINPNLFLFSFALGVPMALLRLFVCLAAGITAGNLVRWFYRNKILFNFDGFEVKSKCNYEIPKIKRFIKDLNRAIVKTGPYFLAGITLTALFDRYFPKTLLYTLFGSNKGLGVLLATSFGVPLYLCGGGTIPIIRAWLYSGMSQGSAVAFMLSGPATKLNNLSAVKMIFGAKNFSIYIAFNIIFAVISGLVIDLVYSFVK